MWLVTPPAFGRGNRKQLSDSQKYIKELFHACRSNVERLNERLPDSTYDALHHFISVPD